ncbi:hypothetical protein PFISCL1PPCAC_17568 [Pristionchus fissidentatus]|uniref:G protein-coupled receptor n=1 Tax=Pristionchus fissidentatus TaxID=1538716 RepID=A0AAV5W664_9BILA|nr:hypothetical protein PFISCL1PPCAC_17568 [Pristionchus fissidentatus]
MPLILVLVGSQHFLIPRMGTVLFPLLDSSSPPSFPSSALHWYPLDTLLPFSPLLFLFTIFRSSVVFTRISVEFGQRWASRSIRMSLHALLGVNRDKARTSGQVVQPKSPFLPS